MKNILILTTPSKPSPCVGIRTCSDYSPFGVELDGRTLSLEGYRFGYQGSEKDNELKGQGNSYTTEFRQLDPRLGRWFSVDPVIQPWQSPYCSMDDNSIVLSDPLGLFGSYRDALEYKRKNDLRGRIRKDVDGNGFMIVDKEKHISYSKRSQIEVESYYGSNKTDEVIKSIYLYREKDKKRSDKNFRGTDALSFAFELGELTRQFKVYEVYGKSATIVENALKKNQFVHTNGKIYSQNFYGNKYIKSSSITNSISTAKIANKLGKGLYFAGAGLTAYEFIVSDKTNEDYAKLLGSIVISGTSAIPVVGPFISIGLGMADSFGAFDGIYKSFNY